MIIFSAYSSNGQPVNQSENMTGSTPNLSYIWSITGIEEGPVIMALRQEESDLYGQAKYEPDSGQAWNGIVVGSAQGNSVNLVLTALKEDEFSCRLTGTYDPSSEMIAGDLVQVKNGKIINRSKFQAMWINPDISSFKPAEIAASSTILSSAGKDANSTASQAQASAEASSSPAVSSSSSQNTKYHDVRVDADRILTGVGDLSQIPIGMGGSGLGGSGMY